MLAFWSMLVDNRRMSFAEEFNKLDPALLQHAFAKVSDRTMRMVDRELHVEQATEMFSVIREASPAFMVIIERYEETVQMITSLPEGLYSPEAMRMVDMMLGAVAVGEVLAEYARLEHERDLY